ncbi:hypothetical protein FOZ61_004865 [Perkinsus olseni]|uniref:Uncharacterized protein n=1 Tax=Perkinsus olseni TaxID=32597 RepID=A0A7J6LYJ7_PEROL|nr:hypothetical protein FOZ61_004865 [Perkinsus olseni]KAF4663911.1 hypothetical protein FOL46_004506 [Perkinsus olseni]
MALESFDQATPSRFCESLDVVLMPASATSADEQNQLTPAIFNTVEASLNLDKRDLLISCYGDQIIMDPHPKERFDRVGFRCPGNAQREDPGLEVGAGCQMSRGEFNPCGIRLVFLLSFSFGRR